MQEEIRRRKEIGRAYSGTSVFSAKLVCGDCGGWYGHKTWHSTDKYLILKAKKENENMRFTWANVIFTKKRRLPLTASGAALSKLCIEIRIFKENNKSELLANRH